MRGFELFSTGGGRPQRQHGARLLPRRHPVPVYGQETAAGGGGALDGYPLKLQSPVMLAAAQAIASTWWFVTQLHCRLWHVIAVAEIIVCSNKQAEVEREIDNHAHDHVPGCGVQCG